MFRVSALLRLSACGLRHGTFKQGTRNEADSSGSHGLYDKFEYSDDDFVAVDPPNMNVSLLPFQKMGVGWMLHRVPWFKCPSQAIQGVPSRCGLCVTRALLAISDAGGQLNLMDAVRMGAESPRSDGTALKNALTDVSNSQTAITSALRDTYLANQAITSVLLEVFKAHVGVAMHEHDTTKVPTDIPYDRFVGYDPAIHSGAYVGRLLALNKGQSLEKAEAKLEKAEAELKEATAELKEAEAKLEKAKAELKEAEKMWTTVEEIVSIVKDKANHKSLDRLIEFGSSRPGLLKEIREYISKLGKLIGTESQHSRALVLAGSNGVGKTYCSFLIGSGVMNVPSSGPGVRRRVMVSAYCGMNNGWQRCEHEESRINCDGAAGLKSVLYVRLALALQHRAANMDKPWDCLNYRVGKSMTEDDALMVIKDALAKMQQFHSDCEVVVFGVVDEVQLIFENISELDGPRLVLRFLRELQVMLKSTGVLFVGLATGTLFKANQSHDPTLGRNLYITKPFCESFDNLQLGFKDAESLNENEVRAVKMVAYPRARLLQYPMEEWEATVGCGLSVKVGGGREMAQKLLPHALLKTTVYIGDYEGTTWLGHHLPAKPDPPQATGISTDGTSVSTDDDKRIDKSPEELYGDMYVPLDDYLLMIACVKGLTSYKPTIINSNTINPSWSNFENCAGQVIMCIIALATSENSGQAVRDAVISTNPWLKTMFGNVNIPILTKCLRKNATSSKSNMNPFEGCDSLEEVIALGVRQEVKDWISKMGVNTCLMINCGDDAPFDYILFVQVVDPSTKNISLRAVLIDAKHSEKGSKIVDYNGTDISIKHEKVGEALKNGLKTKVGDKVVIPDLEVGPPFIVTNKKKHKKKRSDVEYLTRENMKLGGVTRFLFDAFLVDVKKK